MDRSSARKASPKDRSFAGPDLGVIEGTGSWRHERCPTPPIPSKGCAPDLGSTDWLERGFSDGAGGRGARRRGSAVGAGQYGGRDRRDGILERSRRRRPGLRMQGGRRGKLGWRFREPIATLLVEGKTVGRHYAGPRWELADGSAVAGKLESKADGATPSDIPWLTLSVVAHAGQGVLSGRDDDPAHQHPWRGPRRRLRRSGRVPQRALLGRLHFLAEVTGLSAARLPAAAKSVSVLHASVARAAGKGLRGETVGTRPLMRVEQARRRFRRRGGGRGARSRPRSSP